MSTNIQTVRPTVWLPNSALTCLSTSIQTVGSTVWLPSSRITCLPAHWELYSIHVGLINVDRKTIYYVSLDVSMVCVNLMLVKAAHTHTHTHAYAHAYKISFMQRFISIYKWGVHITLKGHTSNEIKVLVS